MEALLSLGVGDTADDFVVDGEDNTVFRADGSHGVGHDDPGNGLGAVMD